MRVAFIRPTGLCSASYGGCQIITHLTNHNTWFGLAQKQSFTAVTGFKSVAPKTVMLKMQLVIFLPTEGEMSIPFVHLCLLFGRKENVFCI